MLLHKCEVLLRGSQGHILRRQKVSSQDALQCIFKMLCLIAQHEADMSKSWEITAGCTKRDLIEILRQREEQAGIVCMAVTGTEISFHSSL